MELLCESISQSMDGTPEETDHIDPNICCMAVLFLGGGGLIHPSEIGYLAIPY